MVFEILENHEDYPGESKGSLEDGWRITQMITVTCGGRAGTKSIDSGDKLNYRNTR